MMQRLRRVVSLVAVFGFVLVQTTAGQQQAPPQGQQQFPKPPNMRQRQPPPRGADIAENLGKGLIRLGSVMVDMNKKEITIPGRINEVEVLEFLANTKGGFKSYESAIELETNAITLNVGLILIGLDSSRAVIAKADRLAPPPTGDAMDLLVQWKDDKGLRTAGAEELILDTSTKRTLPAANWIYTGSSLVPRPQGGVLLADIDGVLVGFMHTRASLIDYGGTLNAAYGTYRLNQSLIKPGTPVTVIMRAGAGSAK